VTAALERGAPVVRSPGARRPVTDDLAPGVYLEDVYPPPGRTLPTGVPAFLGYASEGAVNAPQPLTLWPQFVAEFGLDTGGYLGCAVRGFFENGGGLCYVVRLADPDTREGQDPLEALRAGLAALRNVDAVDLIGTPDIMSPGDLTKPPDIGAITKLQRAVLADCHQAGGRFAVLDAVYTTGTAEVEQQRESLALDDAAARANGALYHPWLWVPGQDGQRWCVPPCGHVAGIYARSDRRAGPGRAPANMTVEGVLDLPAILADDVIGRLYARGINCMRALPGRDIRVWGARTLSDDLAWRPVTARRVLLTVCRWLERFMADLAFEPNDVRLWVRIMRELTAYLDSLFTRGDLAGLTPAEAFFVKCDGETNPPEATATGQVVTIVGLALTAPSEFVFVRIIHGASGVSIQPAAATA
jgi:uncharacterized protein